MHPPGCRSFRIPILADIPVIGPMFFDHTFFRLRNADPRRRAPHCLVSDSLGSAVTSGRRASEGSRHFGNRCLPGAVSQRDPRWPHCRVRRRFPGPGADLPLRRGHDRGNRIHRPGGNDFRPLDALRSARGRVRVRLLGGTGPEGCDPRHRHPVGVHADAALCRDGDRGRRGLGGSPGARLPPASPTSRTDLLV